LARRWSAQAQALILEKLRRVGSKTIEHPFVSR
jgi:hypothetical protein